jgi:hypothetical protein
VRSASALKRKRDDLAGSEPTGSNGGLQPMVVRSGTGVPNAVSLGRGRDSLQVRDS